MNELTNFLKKSEIFVYKQLEIPDKQQSDEIEQVKDNLYKKKWQQKSIQIKKLILRKIKDSQQEAFQQILNLNFRQVLKMIGLLQRQFQNQSLLNIQQIMCLFFSQDISCEYQQYYSPFKNEICMCVLY
ncbi:unnamed protein product (macronuclear) [Paramecium tetraurelia]|uniref:Uncharacterized protein n=1 Tax=Paramecium tetraurelia TaxID=5888 RepID=A0EGG5_PARTE|nr:uncharacterized protein GSPATT00026730001 [Paramecium tetraurelia]CAK94406.1 unnamed protein product [Paramecium tetraurelia]|eukprot:XP_001461779.1 hypothetical protein (macronuclear) [Paramecium tetraurelia strain d4-2]